MQQLSEHFTDAEFSVSGADSRVVSNARFLAVQIMEPVRDKFGPQRIHSGFRSPVHNEEVGGVENSFHLYLDDQCAADFSPLNAGVTLKQIFDWMRLESDLPFDRVILEHDAIDNEPRVIHVQAYVEDANRRPRKAFFRATGAAPFSVSVECLDA